MLWGWQAGITNVAAACAGCRASQPEVDSCFATRLPCSHLGSVLRCGMRRLQEVWPTHFEARREFKVHVVKQQPQAQTQQQQQGHQPPQQEQGHQGQQQLPQGQQQQTATTSGARPAAGAEDAEVQQQDQEQGQVHKQRQVQGQAQGRPVPALGGSTQARDAVVRHDTAPLPSEAAPAQLVEPGVRPMEETRLGELSLRLSNWPCYLYCHLGCCEHLLLVRAWACAAMRGVG